MDLQDLYRVVNNQANKEYLGEPFSPDDFDLFLRVVNHEFYDQEYQKYIKSLQTEGVDIGVKFIYSSPLSVFYSSYSTNLVSGSAPLPLDYWRSISGVVTIDGNPKTATFLTVSEWDKVRLNVMGRNFKYHPIFMVTQNAIQVIPYNATKAEIMYLRKAKDPKFEYVIGGDDDQVYYMPPGSELRDGAVNLDLYTAGGDLIKENVVSLDNKTVGYVSNSVDLEYEDEYQPELAKMIIAKAAMRSRELNVEQIESQDAKD